MRPASPATAESSAARRSASAEPTAPPAPARDASERRAPDALPLATCTTDPEGRITSVGGAWTRVVAERGAGHLADEAAAHGAPLWDALGAAREHVERAMHLLRAGRAPVVQWELPTPRGAARDERARDERVHLLQLSPIRRDGEQDHAVTGFACALVDVSAGRHAHEALVDAGIALARPLELDRVVAEVAQQARRALACDAFCLALADPALAAGAPTPGPASAVLRVVHQFGYERDERDARADAEASPEPDAALAERLAPAWREALTSRRVGVARGARGVELTAPVVGADGGAALGAMTALVDDGDGPPRVEEAARALATLAAQAAAAVERTRLVGRVTRRHRQEAIGDVAAGVARELRNPLFGISSATQLLRFRVQDDPVVEKNVGRILREVERLNRLVTALLEYGRPAPLRLAPGDPDRVWDDVLEGQRGALEGKALLLDRTRADPPARVRLDAEQLAQAFVHVFVNAVDAAPEASDLSLSATTLPGGAWRCRLHNGGPAMHPDALARAFEIFYSTKPGGTGIGLPIVQRIVEEHGGTIAIESTAEAGTVVTITLPPAGPHPEAH